jgi:hypothetical protein
VYCYPYEFEQTLFLSKPKRTLQIREALLLGGFAVPRKTKKDNSQGILARNTSETQAPEGRVLVAGEKQIAERSKYIEN